ncbi:MAG: MFS transporter [Nocardioides sp.]|uniref:MFS transporter n=1 Tax=Nocardioides sp. TaxID=35761 RepID=UPI0039E60A2E
MTTAWIREPGFRDFLAARTVSWAGNVMSLVAMPVLVYQRTSSATLTGLLAALEALPYLVLGLPAGALADRWNNRRVMTWTSILAGATMLTIPAAHLAGILTVPQIFAVALTVGIAFVFSDASAFGALPVLVGRDRIGSAMATMTAINTVLSIAGPGIAGVLIASVGAPWVVAIDGVAYAIAALLLARMPWDPGAIEKSDAPTSLRAEIAEGLAFVWAHPVIRQLTFMGIGLSVTGGAVAGLTVVLAVEQLGFADDDGRLGLLYVAASIGAFLGSVALGWLQRNWTVGAVTVIGYAAVSLLTIALGATTSWVLAAAVMIGFNLVSTVVILNGIVVRQTLTPMRLQSRVNTTARMIAWGGSPAGAAIGGVLAGAWGVDVAFFVCAGSTAVALAVGLFTRVRLIGRLASLTDAVPAETR